MPFHLAHPNISRILCNPSKFKKNSAGGSTRREPDTLGRQKRIPTCCMLTFMLINDKMLALTKFHFFKQLQNAVCKGPLISNYCSFRHQFV